MAPRSSLDTVVDLTRPPSKLGSLPWDSSGSFLGVTGFNGTKIKLDTTVVSLSIKIYIFYKVVEV